jgi:hypothetical protein
MYCPRVRAEALKFAGAFVDQLDGGLSQVAAPELPAYAHPAIRCAFLA